MIKAHEIRQSNLLSEDVLMKRQHKRGYVLLLLTSVFTVNVLDRKILIVMAEPIKAEFKMSDSELGLLTGFAFSALYLFTTLVIGRIADRRDRFSIITIAVTCWSLATIACGMAQNLIQLLIARMTVGLSEGGSSPACLSLISEYYPAEERSTAMAVYALGAAAGGILGLAAGGMIGGMYGWRTAVVCVGLPGLLLGGLLFLFKDPREAKVAKSGKPSPAPGTGLRYVLSVYRAKPSIRWLNLAGIASAAMMTGHLAFLGSFLLRSYPAELDQLALATRTFLGIPMNALGVVGLVMGMLFGVFGGIGTYLGGSAADRFSKKSKRSFLAVPAVAFFFAPLLMMLAFVSTSLALTLLFASFGVLAGMAMSAPSLAASQTLAPVPMRSTSAAIMVACNIGVGGGLGPLAVGMFSDHFSSAMTPAGSIRLALCLLTLIGWVACLMFWRSSQFADRDFEG